MSRRLGFLDRFAGLVVGVVLLVVGVALGSWALGELERFDSVPSDASGAAGLMDLADASWWPWASAGAGVLLLVLALAWLAAHLGRGRVGSLSLRTGRPGRVSVDASSVARAAADTLEQDPEVQGASAHLRRERGHLVLDLRARVEPSADLGRVGDAMSLTLAQASRVLGRSDVQFRGRIQVARSASRGRELL
jgi:hypothetical protein